MATVEPGSEKASAMARPIPRPPPVMKMTRGSFGALGTMPTLDSQHAALSTLHPARCTQHFAPCTLHPAPSTLQSVFRPVSRVLVEKRQGLERPHAIDEQDSVEVVGLVLD